MHIIESVKSLLQIFCIGLAFCISIFFQIVNQLDWIVMHNRGKINS